MLRIARRIGQLLPPPARRGEVGATLMGALAATLLSAMPAASQQDAFTVDDVFDVSTLRVLDVAPSGDWVVVGATDLRGRLGTVAARTGDPTYVSPFRMHLQLVSTSNGQSVDVLPERATVAAARFSPDGERLALLVRRDDQYRLALFDVASQSLSWPPLPAAMRLAGEQGQAPIWMSDDQLLLPVRDRGWAAAAAEEFERLTEGPITEYKGDDPFLAWEALRRQGAEVGLMQLDLADGEVTSVMESTQLGRGGIDLAGDHLVYEADITEKTSYDVIFGVTAEARVRAVDGGDERTLVSIPETRRLRWSKDRTAYAYTNKGHVFVGSLDDEPRSVTGEPDEEPSEDGGDDEEAPERFSVTAISHDGELIIATSKTGVWSIDTDSGDRVRLVETDEDEEYPDRFNFVDWSPDGQFAYFSFGAGSEWRRGLVRFDTETGARDTLMEDDRLYTGFTLSDDGSTIVYSAASGNRPYDLYAADTESGASRRIVETNPALASKALGTTELVDYLDVDGDKLFGVLYYPVDYTPGTPVPTVFLVYERFFDNRFNSTIAVLNNAGYAVMQPSVDLEIGFPGEAWMKGVSAAANELVRRGIADPERLGVHGTSYGGYATNLLITQTDRFAAAINISGKVDMVSFYFDSPRLGVRNIHAPENSQDRLGATLWEQPQKYIAHSAVMAADRIETPLLLMTGEEDHNVPARTTLEMYYALRRLDKTVEWVNYTNGGHGMPRTTEAEVRHYHERIVEWYDRFLKEKPVNAATDAASGSNRDGVEP